MMKKNLQERERVEKLFPSKSKEHYEAGEPEIGLLGESIGKNFEYYILYSAPTPEKNKVRDHYMFGP